MAAGELEAKIGELAGQLKMLIPSIEALSKKLGETREILAANQESLKLLWGEIRTIKGQQTTGSKRWWEAGLALISSAAGALATWFVMRGGK